MALQALKKIPKHIVSPGGVSIYYDRIRGTKASDSSVILLHGMGGDSSAWDQVRTQLTALGLTTIAIDLRGHGKSARPRSTQAYALETIASDVIAVIEAEKLTQPILAGHCFGGITALITAAKYPNLKQLILVNVGTQLPAFLRGFTPLSQTWLRLLASIGPSQYRSLARDYRKFIGRGDFYLPRILSDVTHTSLKSYTGIGFHTVAFNAQKYTPAVQVPTLVLAGGKDHIFNTKLTRALAKQIKKSAYQEIALGNHLLVFNHSAEVAQHIQQFITQYA